MVPYPQLQVDRDFEKEPEPLLVVMVDGGVALAAQREWRIRGLGGRAPVGGRGLAAAGAGRAGVGLHPPDPTSGRHGPRP